MTKEQYQKILQVAKDRIEHFGMPNIVNFENTIKHSKKLAKKLGANVRICKAGAALIDITQGIEYRTNNYLMHAFSGGKFARDLLTDLKIDKEEIEKIVNCVESHHQQKPYNCLEAEIVGNADCYRFVTPKCIMYSMFLILGDRKLSREKTIELLKFKIEEKLVTATLPICIQELEHKKEKIFKILDENKDQPIFDKK